MIVTRMDDPLIAFLGDAINPHAAPLIIAAFEQDDLGNPVSNRTKGVHLSQIIHHIYVRLHGKELEESIDADDLRTKHGRMVVGMAWEHVLSWGLAKVFPSSTIISIGELQKDNIWMTPDRIDMENWIVDEFKATWRSTRRAATPEMLKQNFDYWIWQVMAYCYVLGTNFGRITVLFVNGDYSYSKEDGGPQIWRWSLQFTDKDLESNWLMLIRVGREIGLL